MTRWPMVALRDVAIIDRTSVQPQHIESGTAYVGLEDIESFTGRLDPKPVDAGVLASSKFRFTSRHVLYGKLRPYLAKIACPDFAGICSTDILPIVPGPRIHRRYLFHFIRRPEAIAFATAQSGGANLPRLSRTALEAFQLPLPPLVEQRRIAEILDTVEILRAKRRLALEQLTVLVGSVFVDRFGDRSSNPQGWVVRDLHSLIVNGPQNGLYRPAADYGRGVPILRIDAFYDGAVVDLESLKRVDVGASDSELYGLVEGDIVVNRVNSIDYLGKCALIPKLAEPTVFESNMMRFRVDTSVVHPRFLVQVFQTSHLKAQIRSRAKRAVNQASINQLDVGSFCVPVPPLTLQHEFVSHVAAIEKLHGAARASSVALGSLFASLQHRAFTGII